MIFYNFVSARYGLENLRNRRLKISEFNNVNDPFELLGIELNDRDIRAIVKSQRKNILKNKGLLCFSEDRHNPVQWAHYADNHKGMCLGFEIPEEKLKKVKYVSERLDKDVLNQMDYDEKILTTKFSHWSYEKERRLIIKLSNHPAEHNGLRFYDFMNGIELKEIYIGCKSSLKFEDIKSAYTSKDKSVIVKMTRPSFKDFRIVWNQRFKSLRI